MGWISLSNLLLFINSVVWNGNAVNWAPIYCDIVTKILVGVSVAIPAAALCINRRLYHIVNVTTVTKTASEKRRGVLVDLAIGVGIPVIIMILHVVVQGHRFDIFEDVGCWPTTYNTGLAYALVLGPPLGLAVIAFVYSVLCIITLKRNYVEFKKILSNGTNHATPNRYIRLMSLAAVEALFDIPVNLYVIIAHRGDVQPWISWEETHFDFNRFDAFPAMLWRSAGQEAIDIERARWTVVACGLLFFAFFGFADEAIKNYKLAYNFFARKLGLKLAHIPGVTPVREVVSNPGFYSNSNGGSDRTLGGKYNHGGEKAGGLFKTNGAEPWMNSFDAFASKVKLVVLQSPKKGTFTSSGQESTLHGNTSSRCLTPLSSTTIPQSEVVETRPASFHSDVDAMSTLTQFTDFTGSSIPGFVVEGVDGTPRPVSGLRRRSSYFGSDDSDDDQDTHSEFVHSEAHTNVTADSISEYSQLSPKTPVPPPVPPKDLVYASPLITAASLPASLIAPPPSALLPGYHHTTIPSPSSGLSISTQLAQQQRRTPPRQTIPISVSVSPTPHGSFLDLRASVISEDLSPVIRDAHSVYDRV